MADSMAWATSINKKVTEITGIDIRLWSNVHGPDVGRLTWAGFVPDLRTLEAATDRLQADKKFNEEADRGAKFNDGRFEDGLMQILHGEPNLNMEVNYVGTVRTVCANGHIAQGLKTGVELAEQAEKVTGVPTLFLVGVTGPYGSVGWSSGYESIQAFESAQEALATDGSWIDRVDREAGHAYHDDPSFTVQRLLRRIA